MRIENDQIKNIVNPIDPQDAMTMDTASSTAGGIPRVYRSNVQQTSVWEYLGSTTVSGGNAVFNLTTDGTSTGPAIFPTAVFTESINITIFDTTNSYIYGAPTIGTGNKTITFVVNRIGLSLGIIVFTAAANGITVKLSVKGN